MVNAARTAGDVRDARGRPIHDLRVSVIDRCNLRCTYCMPAATYHERYRFLDEGEWLSFEEIERVVRAFVGLGVSKVRITGGEPLLRPGVADLVARLAPIAAIDDLALTTNGLLLPRYAAALRDAGLHRLTVSLDSVDDDVNGAMNGRGRGAGEVMAGIDAAVAAGFERIKINAVIRRGVNEDGALELVDRFRGTGHVVRFIEYMDVGNRNGWLPGEVVPSRELLERIDERYPLVALEEQYRGEVASRYAFADGGGEIGFISSVSEPFCGDCSRARLSADGAVFTCLFAQSGTDLRALLRGGAGDEELAAFLTDLWSRRADRYSELRAAGLEKPSAKVEMYHIGG